ncbi:hypothetical protein ILUMI_15754, partial [Ignelater luminosus]
YYWKDYDGTVPKDALFGGIDKRGRPMYLARTLFEDKLISGKVFADENYIHFGWFDEKKLTQNIKILCTKNTNNFEWIPTRLNDITRLTGKLVVIGGFQSGHITYIGRISSNRETNVGKVICNEKDCQGLYVTKDGKEIHHTNVDLEVLSYRSDLAVSNANCINYDR